MEESGSGGHQRQRKRSSDNNAFAKFVPFSPPLGHDPDDEVDHGHKRLKPNSESLFSETTFNSSTSFPLVPKQNIGTHGATDFSSASSSIKLSGNSGPSPQSIGSKSSHMKYVQNDGKAAKKISTSYYHRKEYESEIESVVSMAAEELSKRPKTEGIYKAIEGHRDCIVKRLKDLSNKEPTIDVGLEMADAAYLLKLMKFSTNEIEMAGQKGHKVAMLLVQAEILQKEGQELIAECQNLIGDTL